MGLFVIFKIGAESVPNAADIENHLELGKQFLAHNQLSDALTHYHAAVGRFSFTISFLFFFCIFLNEFCFYCLY